MKILGVQNCGGIAIFCIIIKPHISNMLGEKAGSTTACQKKVAECGSVLCFEKTVTKRKMSPLKRVSGSVSVNAKPTPARRTRHPKRIPKKCAVRLQTTITERMTALSYLAVSEVVSAAWLGPKFLTFRVSFSYFIDQPKHTVTNSF